MSYLLVILFTIRTVSHTDTQTLVSWVGHSTSGLTTQHTAVWIMHQPIWLNHKRTLISTKNFKHIWKLFLQEKRTHIDSLTYYKKFGSIPTLRYIWYTSYIRIEVTAMISDEPVEVTAINIIASIRNSPVCPMICWATTGATKPKATLKYLW